MPQTEPSVAGAVKLRYDPPMRQWATTILQREEVTVEVGHSEGGSDNLENCRVSIRGLVLAYDEPSAALRDLYSGEALAMVHNPRVHHEYAKSHPPPGARSHSNSRFRMYYYYHADDWYFWYILSNEMSYSTHGYHGLWPDLIELPALELPIWDELPNVPLLPELSDRLAKATEHGVHDIGSVMQDAPQQAVVEQSEALLPGSIDEVSGDITSVASGIVLDSSAWAVENGQATLEPALEQMASAGEAVMAATPGVVSAAGEAASNIASEIPRAVSNATAVSATTGESAADAVEAAATAAPGVAEQAVEASQSAVEGVPGAVSTIGGSAADAIGGLESIELPSEAETDVVATAPTAISDMASGVAVAASDADCFDLDCCATTGSALADSGAGEAITSGGGAVVVAAGEVDWGAVAKGAAEVVEAVGGLLN